MHMNIRRKSWRAWGVAAVGFCTIGAYILFAPSSENKEAVASIITHNKPVVVSTSTIPLVVHGVVESTDRAVVAAETAGVIERLHVQEGSQVQAGALLVSQTAPVAEATYSLRKAELELTNAQQKAQIDLADKTHAKASVVAHAAEEVAYLQRADTDNRVREAANGLLRTAEANLTVLLDAVQFVNDHKSLFESEAFPLYREVVASLYGSIPVYFQGSVAKTVHSDVDLISYLKSQAAAEEVSVVEMQNIYNILKTQNVALLEVYSYGEREVLDRMQVSSASVVYEEYFAQRTVLHQTQTALESSNAALTAALDAAATRLVTEGQSVQVSTIDEDSSKQQSVISKEIAAAAAQVGEASRKVSAAQLSLVEVRAPFNGVVTKHFLEEGEFAHAGTPLLQLAGVNGAEVRVQVPLMFADQIKLGQAFVVDGETVGALDRFSTVSDGNVISAVIVLTQDVASVGSTIKGRLLLSGEGNIFTLPRPYVHFETDGAFVVVMESGEKYPVSIVYDIGSELYISANTEIPRVPLRPAYSVVLR